jgi:hypothetical protein
LALINVAHRPPVFVPREFPEWSLDEASMRKKQGLAPQAGQCLTLFRDNATASTNGNFGTATPALFVNPTTGDLHLLPSATNIINKAFF